LAVTVKLPFLIPYPYLLFNQLQIKQKMKKFLTGIIVTWLIILLLGNIKCTAQLNTGLGIGYDTHGRAIASWSAGYEKGRFNVEGQIRPSLTRNVKTNNYIGGNIGLNLINAPDAYLKAFSLIAYAGYFYDRVSNDKLILNKYYFSGSLRAIKMINENGGIFAETMYINKSIQASFGIHFKFD